MPTFGIDGTERGAFADRLFALEEEAWVLGRSVVCSSASSTGATPPGTRSMVAGSDSSSGRPTEGTDGGACSFATLLLYQNHLTTSPGVPRHTSALIIAGPRQAAYLAVTNRSAKTRRRPGSRSHQPQPSPAPTQEADDTAYRYRRGHWPDTTHRASTVARHRPDARPH